MTRIASPSGFTETGISFLTLISFLFQSGEPPAKPNKRKPKDYISLLLAVSCFFMSTLVPTSTINEFVNWDVLQKFLPQEWEEQAKLCGAMRRARYIKSPGAVLRTLELAEYFIMWTSLKKLRASEVLELYRLRWQIELVFKRMKSILGLGHLPKKDPLSAQAWLEGKLFVGLLIEHMVDAAAAFFTWDYPLETAPQTVAVD